MRLFLGAFGPDFVYMDDNARPHRAWEQYLAYGDIRRLDWPAHSLDLNPIVHVWDVLGRRVARCQPPAGSVQGLRRALVQGWDRPPQELLDSLVCSVPARCGTCIAVHGGTTHLTKLYGTACKHPNGPGMNNACSFDEDVNNIYLLILFFELSSAATFTLFLILCQWSVPTKFGENGTPGLVLTLKSVNF